MKVLTFESITTDSPTDLSLTDEYSWSRVYEYATVIQKIKELVGNTPVKIHNSSSGFSELHNSFKKRLEEDFGVENCTHTDIVVDKLTNTSYYDITTKNSSYESKFDIVLNVSTLEEIRQDTVECFKNLYDQVVLGGYLIITFDLAALEGWSRDTLNLELFENYLGVKYLYKSNYITGENSIVKNPRYAGLTCGLLVVQK